MSCKRNKNPRECPSPVDCALSKMTGYPASLFCINEARYERRDLKAGAMSHGAKRVRPRGRAGGSYERSELET